MSVQHPPPPPSLAEPVSSRVRPWWGMGDALLIIPIMFGVLLVSFVVMVVLLAAEGMSLAEWSEPGASTPGSVIVVLTLIQQLTWIGWPFVVSRWKGLGPAADWGWSFQPIDIGIGLGSAMIGLFAAGLAGAGTSALVGLDGSELADNTAIVSDLEGSPWLWGILALVVVGAPLSEELLFRGLVLRSVAKRWGNAAGIVVSLAAFVPFHAAEGGVFTDGLMPTDGQIVLWATISALGLVLGVVAVSTGRLAGAVIAHMVINAVGAAGALGFWDDLTTLG